MHEMYAHFAKAEGPFQLTLVLYTLAFLAYLASLWAPKFRDEEDRIYQVARVLFLAAWAANAYTLIGRGIAAGRPPFKTFYESLIYFGFIFGGLMVAVEWLKKVRFLGVLANLLILGALGYALHKQDIEIINLPPALNSGWFLPHVTIYFCGYSCVTVAFVLGILALLKPGTRSMVAGSFWARALGATEVDFEQLTIRWIRAGFLFLAAGLITGGTWAKFAWSDYWSWDPKENWGLITWLVYAGVLHLQHTKWKGRPALKLSLVAWGFIAFTYFGMGYLPTKSQSMHVYTEVPPPGQDSVKGVNKDMY